MLTEKQIKERIYELCEKEITPENEKELAQLIEPYKNGSVGIAQINTISGNIEYNSKKIVKYIKHAQNIGLDIIIFPEMTLTGFPIEDSINRYPLIGEENIKWLKSIAKFTKKTTAVVGFIEPVKCDKTSKKSFYNSVAILNEGKIQNIIRKTILPTYSKFNDYKYFESSAVIGSQDANTLGIFCENNQTKCNKTNVINGRKYAITIGEDIFYNKEFFNEQNSSNIDPIEELGKEKPDIFINCSSFPANRKTEQLKSEILSFISKKYSAPTVYVNQVGAIDSTSFDGGSKVFDSEGNLIAQSKYFEEQFLIVNPFKNLGKIYPEIDIPKKILDNNSFSLDYEYDLERTYKTIIQGIKDYFQKSGFTKAVLGLSGGLDSTVCAVLLADALGKENVFGISMPSKITSNESKSDAQQLAQNLGINFTQIPIKEMYEATNNTLQELFKVIEQSWDNRYKESFTSDNIQARSRAVILWGVSNEFGQCLPIATSDKSEAYVGYATINGDMSGGFAPIADVTKTKLFALARWMNKNRPQKNAIPESIILKRPGAELAIDPKTGKPLAAEDALMPYEFMDEIIWRIENKKEHYYDMIDSEFLYEKKNNISKEQKEKWLDKFYKRMAGALYKWSILPPTIVVDESRAISKYDYRQPISSSKINYKGLSEEQIDAVLKS